MQAEQLRREEYNKKVADANEKRSKAMDKAKKATDKTRMAELKEEITVAKKAIEDIDGLVKGAVAAGASAVGVAAGVRRPLARAWPLAGWSCR